MPLNTALYEPPLDPELPALDSDGDSDDAEDGRGDEKRRNKGTSVRTGPAPCPPLKHVLAACLDVGSLAGHRRPDSGVDVAEWHGLCELCYRGRCHGSAGGGAALPSGGEPLPRVLFRSFQASL